MIVVTPGDDGRWCARIRFTIQSVFDGNSKGVYCRWLCLENQCYLVKQRTKYKIALTSTVSVFVGAPSPVTPSGSPNAGSPAGIALFPSAMMIAVVSFGG